MNIVKCLRICLRIQSSKFKTKVVFISSNAMFSKFWISNASQICMWQLAQWILIGGCWSDPIIVDGDPTTTSIWEAFWFQNSESITLPFHITICWDLLVNMLIHGGAKLFILLKDDEDDNFYISVGNDYKWHRVEKSLNWQD